MRSRHNNFEAHALIRKVPPHLSLQGAYTHPSSPAAGRDQQSCPHRQDPLGSLVVTASLKDKFAQDVSSFLSPTRFDATVI